MSVLTQLCEQLPKARTKEAVAYIESLIKLGEPQSKAIQKTWSEVMEELPVKRGGHSVAIRVGICNCAASILKRPPLLEDIEEDFISILVKRLRREHPGKRADEYRYMMNRFEQLKLFAAHCSSKYKIQPFDWSGMVASRRYELQNEIEANGDSEAAATTGGALDQPVKIDAKFANVRLTEVVQRYVDEKLLGKSPNSSRLLRYAERRYSEYLTRPALLADLNSDTLRRYLAYLLGGNLSRRSVLCNQERLNSLWRFASKKGWLNTEPDLPLVTLPEVAPEAWTREEMEAILKAAAAVPGYMKGPMSNVPYSLYWRALVFFLSDTGERIGGALGLGYADISGEWVTVRAENRKGKTRDKRFKLRPDTLEAIGELRKLTNPKEVKTVFHWPLDRAYLWGKFSQVLELAELPDNRRNKFHKFRRTTATEFEAAGGNASKLLDHRNRATTEKYIDTRLIKELMPADIVPGIGEKRTSVVGSSSDELLAKMRALLEGAKK